MPAVRSTSALATRTDTPRASIARTHSIANGRARGRFRRHDDASRALFLGFRLRLLAHDDDLLTVHLDGAPVGGRFALGLRSAALAPLAKLLLQVLEHPAPPADPPSVAGRPARGPVGLASATAAERRSPERAPGSGYAACGGPSPRSAGCARA